MPPCHGGGRGFESRPVRLNKDYNFVILILFYTALLLRLDFQVFLTLSRGRNFGSGYRIVQLLGMTNGSISADVQNKEFHHGSHSLPGASMQA